MINKSVFEDEIIAGFQKELIKQASPVETPNLMKAAECLHAALEIFENAGLTKQADQMLQLLEKIAKKPVADRHVRGLTPKKQLSNLMDHGTQFNLSDDVGFVLDLDEADDELFDIDIDAAFDKDIPLSDFEDD